MNWTSFFLLHIDKLLFIRLVQLSIRSCDCVGRYGSIVTVESVLGLVETNWRAYIEKALCVKALLLNQIFFDEFLMSNLSKIPNLQGQKTFNAWN